MQEPKLSNIPLYNLLEEFIMWEKVFQDPNFLIQFDHSHTGEIVTPLLVWLGAPNDLLTLVLQRSILGLESYVPGAVWIELGNRGILDKNNNELIRNPFSFGSRKGTAHAYFNDLPTLVCDECALSFCNAQLWQEAVSFYKHTRNPIFHGKQLGRETPEVVVESLTLIREIYEWIDKWHKLEIREIRPKYITLKLGNVE